MIEISHIIPHIFIFLALYFQIFLLVTFFENKEKLKIDSPRGIVRYPSVAIIVPCWNEEKTVAGTIHSLLKLDYPKEKLNIIAVDDGSTDQTFEIMKTFTHEPQVTILKKENGGKHTAINLGISRTEAEIIGCLDADSFVAPNALIEIVRTFNDSTVMAVTPAVKIHEPKTPLELLQRAEYNMGIFFRKIFGIMNAIQVTPGPFSFFRKKVFDELGGFREAYNTEDMEMALRMQSKHYRIENAHTAHVYTVAPKTLKGLHKQRVRWVYGFLKNISDYRFMLFNKQYGHLGALTLPFAIISIFGAIYMFSFVVIRIANMIAEKLIEIETIGFSLGNFEFNWFFTNTKSLVILSVVGLSITFFILIQGKKLSEGTGKISRDMFYFLLFYGFIAPVWLSRAVYNVIISKKSAWR